MIKLRFWFSLFYKLLASVASGIVLFIQYSQLGTNAWQLLETWLLMITAGYFLIAVFVEWFHRKQSIPHRSFCPLLQGMIITVGISLSVLRIWLDIPGFISYIQLLVIALLAAIDWALFTKKGGWGIGYPWYWLGIIISYFCIIILTANLMPQGDWAYPYYFLNYLELGADNLVLWVVLTSVIVLITGYVFVSLDYTASGQLGRHIVMPKIKTIIIEEPLVDELEPNTQNAVAQDSDTNAEPSPTKSAPAPKPKKQSTLDVVKPVEGLKDKKSAQKLHRASRNGSKSKSEIIADMRLQVSGNKSPKSRPRAKKS